MRWCRVAESSACHRARPNLFPDGKSPLDRPRRILDSSSSRCAGKRDTEVQSQDEFLAGPAGVRGRGRQNGALPLARVRGRGRQDGALALARVCERGS